jgi:hypothetical protein
MPFKGAYHLVHMAKTPSPKTHQIVNDKEAMRRFAAAGALMELEKLRLQVELITRTFPSLRKLVLIEPVFDVYAAGSDFPKDTLIRSDGSIIEEPRRKRARMSAAQRKAVSARMKKYWAKRRAQGAKKR